MSPLTKAEPVQLSDEERVFFGTHGYLKLERVLEGKELARVQERFHHVEESTREEWRRTVAAGPDFRPYKLGETAHVVFPIAPHGAVFVDLLEHPRTIHRAEALMGPDVQMCDNALHVKPAGTKSHTVWHRDTEIWFHADADQWSEEDKQAWEQMGAGDTPLFKIKIFFFVEDVNEDTAPFSVVPGSHKLDDGGVVPQYENLCDMPGHVRLVGKAGDAILWSGHIWHTAMDNTGDRARRMLLYNYTHFGLPQHEPCIPKGEFREYLRQRSPRCRQLFGLERMSRKRN